MRPNYTIAAVFIIIAATAITFTVLTWILTQQPNDTIPIKQGLTPHDMYPLQLDGWRFTIHFDGHYNTANGAKSDLYIAERGSIHLEDTTLSGLLRQIKQNQD